MSDPQTPIDVEVRGPQVEVLTRAQTEDEQRYRLLVEATNVVLWEADPAESRHTYVSPNATDLLGYPRNDWFDPGFWTSHLHPDDRDAITEAVRARLADGADHDVEYRMIAADGRVVWIHDLGKVLTGPDDPRQRGVLIDITERKRDEAELAAVERRYRDLVENAADMMYSLDGEGRLTYVSESLVRNLGYTTDELLGRQARTIIDEADHGKTDEAFHARLRGESVAPYEFSLLCKDGRTIAIEINSSATYACDGACTGTQAILRDISERRKSESAIRESQERFDLVTRATRDVIYDWDLPSTVVWRNENYRQIYGAPEWMDANSGWWEQLLHPDDRTRVTDQLRNALTGSGDRWAEEYRFQRRDGEFAHIVDRGFIVRDKSGKAIRLIGAMTDVTDHKRNQRLMRAIVEATASSVGDEFFPSLVRVVARELKARFVLLTERVSKEGARIRSVAVCSGGEIADSFEADLAGMPCAPVLAGQAVYHARNVNRDFPDLAAILGFTPESYCGFPLQDVAGQVIGHLGIVDDKVMEVDPRELPILRIFVARAAAEVARIRAEQRTQLMMRELDHRVKNNLSVILALAQLTSGRVSSLDDFMPAFTGRIQSMVIAHELLAHSRWQGVDLKQMAEQMLEPFRRDEPCCLSMNGPALLLPTGTATALCMVLHELATNAAKYGALSIDGGRVELTWSVTGAEGSQCLDVSWQEIDGPAVTTPGEPGFGTDLIEGVARKQMRGKLDLVFDPAGVRCHLSVPYGETGDGY